MFRQRFRYIHVLGGVCAGAQVLNDLLSNYHRSLLDVMYMKDSLSRAKYSTLASCLARSASRRRACALARVMAARSSEAGQG